MDLPAQQRQTVETSRGKQDGCVHGNGVGARFCDPCSMHTHTHTAYRATRPPEARKGHEDMGRGGLKRLNKLDGNGSQGAPRCPLSWLPVLS